MESLPAAWVQGKTYLSSRQGCELCATRQAIDISMFLIAKTMYSQTQTQVYLKAVAEG